MVRCWLWFPGGGCRDVGGEIGDEGDAQYLGAELAGGDGFEGGGHADEIGAEEACHADLGINVRAGHAVGGFAVYG